MGLVEEAERGMSWLGRRWAAIVGLPARALAKRLSSRFPTDEYDGIALVVADERSAGQARELLARTREALACAATRAPKSYARLRKDLTRVVLLADEPASVYHPFQFAALVRSSTALDLDQVTFAALLLYASGLSRDREEAIERTEELLLTLGAERRAEIGIRLSRIGLTPERDAS
jgi:hypothetical protein